MIEYAVAKNRDGSEDLVDILCRESSGNFYVFTVPCRPFKEDNGRSVRAEYVRRTCFGRTYQRIAAYFILRFPEWVTL